VKCLVDAQLPQQLAYFLTGKNIESKHTLNLSRKNKTPDSKIIQIANQEGRIVVTKDSDFLDNYILDGKPKQLLIVSTGNISNDKLIRLFGANLETLKSSVSALFCY
jgi:predicted nuclease of predicted toxin-antitoxin system